MGLQEMLLTRLKTQNPAGYKFVMEVKQSGRNPIDVLREMYQKGQINDQQLMQIQQHGRMFGVRITASDINKIKAVDNNVNNPQTNKKFGGWF